MSAHLHHMAGVLQSDDDTGPAPPRDLLTTRMSRARAAVDDVTEAARGNRRARRAQVAVDAAQADLAGLERVVLLVDDLHDLSADQPWGTRMTGLAAELRAPMAHAAEALADAVTVVELVNTHAGHRRQSTTPSKISLPHSSGTGTPPVPMPRAWWRPQS